MSAVVHINNNNDLEALEKRKSFAEMKTVNVTNHSFHNNTSPDDSSSNTTNSKLSSHDSPDDCINLHTSELVSIKCNCDDNFYKYFFQDPIHDIVSDLECKIADLGNACWEVRLNILETKI